MSVLDRYVSKMFLSGYFILVAVSLALYVIFDLLVNFDEFIENKDLTVWQMLYCMGDYYLFNLPVYFSQIGGPLLAIAGAFTLGNMLRNNEMTALIASGVPLQRIAAPLLVSSIFLIVICMVNQEFVIPSVAHKVARERDDVMSQSTQGVMFAREARRGDNPVRQVCAQVLNLKEGTLENVVFLEYSENKIVTSYVRAEVARYDPEGKLWLLERGFRQWLREGDVNQPIAPEPLNVYEFNRTPEELRLLQKSEWTDMLSLRQMSQLMKKGTPLNLPVIISQRHIRSTQPLLYMVLVMLAIPFFMSREPGGVLGGAVKALVVCGLFLVVAFVAHGISGDNYVVLRIWVPILCFGPLAVLQLANVKT